MKGFYVLALTIVLHFFFLVGINGISNCHDMALLAHLVHTHSAVCSGPSRCLGRGARLYATVAGADVFDIAVIGGGPAGLSLLTALRKF